MGTSVSNKGPGAGVSLDPAWLDSIEIPNQESEVKKTEEFIGGEISPPARFSSARRNMGEYVRSGNRDSLRKSIGHYSKTGMGGSSNIARRMRTSTKVATGFFNAFRSLRDDDLFELGKTIERLRHEGASANRIIDTVVENICPKGGSIDEISTRDSGKSALSDFLLNNPEADICKLTDDQIWTLTGMFLGNEVFNRIQLDIGQAFEKQNISIVDKITRMNDMRDYIKSEVAVQLDKVRNSGNATVNTQELFEKIIDRTFAVFEVEI